MTVTATEKNEGRKGATRMGSNMVSKTNLQEWSVVRETHIHNHHHEVELCCQEEKNVLSPCGYLAKVDISRCNKSNKTQNPNYARNI